MRKAILHIDGDSFFASCEVALNPALKGKPVVTGQERGIASSMSKEAKVLGVTRGMPVFKIRQMFPQVVILSSDYGVYETFAKRMYAIVRRYSDQVEEYSIDECFARLPAPEAAGNGGQALEDIVRKIKQELQGELGMTFSLGVAETKVLAKLASSKNKPDGLTILHAEQVEEFLKDVDIGKVWGIGPATAGELRASGILTALDFRNKKEGQGNKHTCEIWHELNGTPVFPIGEAGDSPKSIQATRTFTPPSKDETFLLSELSKNIENACVKVRQNGLAVRKVYMFLKTQEFRYERCELILDTPATAPAEIIKHARASFRQIYKPRTLYRATGVTLSGLVPHDAVQRDLYGAYRASDKWRDVYKVVDEVDRKYGSHTLTLTSSLEAFKRRGGAIKKRLNLPYMGEVS